MINNHLVERQIDAKLKTEEIVFIPVPTEAKLEDNLNFSWVTLFMLLSLEEDN